MDGLHVWVPTFPPTCIASALIVRDQSLPKGLADLLLKVFLGRGFGESLKDDWDFLFGFLLAGFSKLQSLA